MIDLRHAYFDPKLFKDAALAMRSSKSLLLWYTADECVAPRCSLTLALNTLN